MNISASHQGTSPPNFNAYAKFAATPEDKDKIVVGVEGHKIKIATEGQSTSSLPSYIADNGLEFELSPEESKKVVVDHFKQALRLKYGEEARDFFSPTQERDALAHGLSHHIVKDVTGKAKLRDLFEEVRSCSTELAVTLDQYNKFQQLRSHFTAAERGETALKLAQLMLRHQTLVADFKTAAEHFPDQERAQSMLQSIAIREQDPVQTAHQFLQAAKHFTEAAGQAIDNVDSRSSTTKKQATAEQYLQKAEKVLAKLQDPLLNATANDQGLKNNRAKILQEIHEIHFNIKREANRILTPPQKKAPLITSTSAPTSSSAASETDDNNSTIITQEKLKSLHDDHFSKSDVQQEKKSASAAAPKKAPPAAAGGVRIRF